MTIYDNASKIRARKMAWMRQDWPWWLIFTDVCADLLPKYSLVAPSLGWRVVNLGFAQFSMDQCQNAP